SNFHSNRFDVFTLSQGDDGVFVDLCSPLLSRNGGRQLPTIIFGQRRLKDSKVRSGDLYCEFCPIEITRGHGISYLSTVSKTTAIRSTCEYAGISSSSPKTSGSSSS